MPLIHYQKKSKIVLLLLFTIFLSSYIKAQNVEVKNGEATILRVSFKNKANKLWTLNYIVINKIIYSGDIFIGKNLTCFEHVNQNMLDSINSFGFSDNIELFNRKLDTIRYNHLKIDNSASDKEFFYKCVSVPVKYLILNCNVTTQDYFSFLFTQNYNGVQLIDIECNEIRNSKIPRFMYKKIKQKRQCLEKLKASYVEFNKCLN
jgi:hypothetical protein